MSYERIVVGHIVGPLLWGFAFDYCDWGYLFSGGEPMTLCEYLVEVCDSGAITHYELYRRCREGGCWKELPDLLRTEYEEWARTHPEGVSFTIGA